MKLMWTLNKINMIFQMKFTQHDLHVKSSHEIHVKAQFTWISHETHNFICSIEVKITWNSFVCILTKCITTTLWEQFRGFNIKFLYDDLQTLNDILPKISTSGLFRCRVIFCHIRIEIIHVRYGIVLIYIRSAFIFTFYTSLIRYKIINYTVHVSMKTPPYTHPINYF